MASPGGQELVLGVTQDPTFGPLLTLGFGGVRAEIFCDVASEVLPLSRAGAYDLLESLVGVPLLRRYRGQSPADVETLPGDYFKTAEFCSMCDPKFCPMHN